MNKADRDALLYTNEVSVNSAKFGARPLSQAFKDELLKKWLHDARVEGYDVVLLDGRALEEVGNELEHESLCDYALGLFFVCDSRMGAMRTLGHALDEYNDLSDAEKSNIDELVNQIKVRNAADRNREVQPLVEPASAKLVKLPSAFAESSKFYVVDTSAKMDRETMASPVFELISKII